MQIIEELIFKSAKNTQGFGVINSWVTEAIRLGIYFFAIATSIITQILNPYFLNYNMWIPVYILVVLGLVLHLLIIFSLQNSKKKKYFEIAIFIFDTFFISAISYYTFLTYPIFTVLYLVNLVLCSFVLGSSVSFFLAGVSVFLYTFSLLFRISETGFDPITFILNVIVFYFVALFSGYLGDIFYNKSKELADTSDDLRQLKNLSQIIIKNMGIGLVSFEEGKKISFANDAAKSILGSNLDTANNFIKDYIIQEDSSGTQHTRRQEYDLEINGIKKNLEFISTYVPDAQLQATWILLVQDLTEIKDLQKELQVKEKLAAIGQLAGGIAHEIRNPLASISGSVEMLKETTKDLNPENTKLFSIIIKEIDRLNLLITDFLSFVRPEVKKSDKIFLNGLIKDIIILIKNDKKLSDSVEFTLDLAEVSINCDQNKLQQAILNIITNSLQAIQKQSEKKFYCRLTKEGFFISLEFTDNGPGMSPSVLNRIFEPFYTTKDKGTGLGLAITHRIIEGHEGTIKVFSDEKKGTTFFIRLPIN